MVQSPLRVLVDLSAAGTGYAGIPQDARTMLQLLAGMPDVQVTGLLFPAGSQMEWPAFSQNIDPRGGLRSLASTIETVPLTKGEDLELVWQHFLCQTLVPSERGILQGCNFVLAPLSNRMMYARAALGLPPPVLQTGDWDVAIFHGTPPLRVGAATRKLVRFYDMIPALFPELVANPRVTRAHRLGLKQCAGDSTFVCGSEPARDDLGAAWPELRERSVTIPHALSAAYFPDRNPARLAEILATRRTARIARGPALIQAADYLLTVGTLEPRKNYPLLLEAYAQVAKSHAGLRLVVVGNLGWKYEQAVAAMAPLIERGQVIHLERLAPEEMRVLYSHAAVLVTPSLYEGFGFPPLEAMQCGTAVVASDIPAHRWTLGEAAVYGDPKDAGGFAAAVGGVLGRRGAAQRGELILRGARQVQRYSVGTLAGAWRELLGCAVEAGST